MTLQEKITQKLQPHSERLRAGTNDEFDYLPAVLHHVIEEQSRNKKATTEQIEKILEVQKVGFDSTREYIGSGFSSTRSDLKSGFSALGTDLHQGIGAIRSDLKAGFDSTQHDFRNGIDAVREDLRNAIGSLKGDIRKGVDVLNDHLIQMDDRMAKDRVTTKRFLLAQLTIAVLTFIGVITIAVLLYARR